MSTYTRGGVFFRLPEAIGNIFHAFTLARNPASTKSQ